MFRAKTIIIHRAFNQMNEFTVTWDLGVEETPYCIFGNCVSH